MIKLPEVSRRDAGRILSGLRERNRKLLRGIAKFGDDFDPVLGRNMLQARDAYRRLISTFENLLMEEPDDEQD